MKTKDINKKTVTTLKKVLHSKAAHFTQLFVILVVVILIVWDISLYIKNEPTISKVIYDNAMGDLFVFSWIWGVLAAHLFVCRKRDAKTIPEGAAIILLLLISILIYLLGRFIPEPLPTEMHLVFLVFGGIMGYLLWPQKIDITQN